MSDLISRSALMEAIVNSPTECLKEYSVSSVADAIAYGSATRQNEILDIINEQPTAYNVDAVVEQLENTREKEVISMDKDRNITAVVQKEYIKIDKAIEIVRKGGVE